MTAWLKDLIVCYCSYVDTQSDWERHLPLALYAYGAAVYASTSTFPHSLMFGRSPHSPLFDLRSTFNSTSYQFYRDQLARLKD